MAINKNFVVKNGLEVNQKLILADAITGRVGIGTSQPAYLLDVAGGIGATDVYVRNNLYTVGVSTIIGELNVGIGGTTLTGVGGSIGIGTINPAFLLDVRSPVSIGQTALYVRGDVRITGDLVVEDDLFFDEFTARNANITGIATIATLGVTGLTTTRNLTVIGISTFVGLATFNSGLWVVSGITTLGVTSATNLSAQQLNVSGITTLGVTSATNLTSQQLNVSGISTLNNTLNVVPTANSIAGLFSGTTTDDMVRITQLGSGVALRIEDSTNPDATPFVVVGTGFVGIGTTNPTVELQLSPTASISNVGFGITLPGTVGSALTVAQFVHYNTNASRLRIKATRNATGSDWTTASTKLVNVTDVTEQAYIEYNPNGALSGMAFGQSSTEWARFLSNGNLGIGTTNPIQPFQIGSGSSIFVVDNMGDLGIGTASPTSLLHVQGNTLITGIATVNSNFVVNGNTLVADATNNRVGILTTTPIQPFQVGSGSSIVVVDNTGDVGIGTTNPTSKLTVVGDVLVSGTSTLGTLRISSGIVTSSTVGVSVTYYGDGSKLTGIIASSGGSVGIQSGGVTVGTAITTINFVGTGLTASQSSNTSNVYLPAPGVSLGLAIALGG